MCWYKDPVNSWLGDMGKAKGKMERDTLLKCASELEASGRWQLGINATPKVITCIDAAIY